MSKNLYSNDLGKDFRIAKGSGPFKDLIGNESFSASFAKKEHQEKAWGLLQQSYREAGGDTTKAIARFKGHLKDNVHFTSRDVDNAVKGLKDLGYYVPSYDIKPGEALAESDQSGRGLLDRGVSGLMEKSDIAEPFSDGGERRRPRLRGRPTAEDNRTHSMKDPSKRRSHLF